MSKWKDWVLESSELSGLDRETNLKDKAGDKTVRVVRISQEEGRE